MKPSPGNVVGVDAWQAFDSRGTPTIACRISLAGGVSGTAIAPSGASTGTFEPIERRDSAPAFGGRGVGSAVATALAVGEKLRGLDLQASQSAVDERLDEIDPSAQFRVIGGNVAVALSAAAMNAFAELQADELYRVLLAGRSPRLPMPMVNIISGGAHAGRSVDYQDFLAIPVGATSFSEAMAMAWEVRSGTRSLLDAAGYSTALVADEGGLAFASNSNARAIEFLARGIEVAGFAPTRDVAIAIDVAATGFFRDGVYCLDAEDRRLSRTEMVMEMRALVGAFPIVSLEDPLAEDDWEGWIALREALPATQILGDDLLVTSASRIEQAASRRAANAALIKPNQAGSIGRARRAFETAKAAHFTNVISARSGDTEERWLADLAVGWGAEQIKVGSTARSERTAKWNRLLEIEHDEHTASFAGRSALAPIGRA